MSYVKECYKIPSSNRPVLDAKTGNENSNVPIINLARLRHSEEQRSIVVKEIGNACRQIGFFEVSTCSLLLHGNGRR